MRRLSHEAPFIVKITSGTIKTTISQFREIIENDANAKALRLSNSERVLVLNMSLTLERILQVAGFASIPVFRSSIDVTRWYRNRTPAVLLEKQLEVAVMKRRNLVHVSPSLIKGAMRELPELREMRDSMNLLLSLLLN